MKQASHKGTVTLYDSTYVRYLERSLSQRQEVEQWLARAGVEKESGTCSLMGTEFWFCKIKRTLEMDGGDGCTTM